MAIRSCIVRRPPLVVSEGGFSGEHRVISQCRLEEPMRQLTIQDGTGKRSCEKNLAPVIPNGVRNPSALNAKNQERFLVASLLGMTRLRGFSANCKGELVLRVFVTASAATYKESSVVTHAPEPACICELVIYIV